MKKKIVKISFHLCFVYEMFYFLRVRCDLKLKIGKCFSYLYSGFR